MGMFDAAGQSHDVSMMLAFAVCGLAWCISTYGWADPLLSWAKATVRRVHTLVMSNTPYVVFICLAYFMVASGDASTESDMTAYNDLMRAHAGDEGCMFHAEVASRMSEMWSQTMVMPAVHPMAELVLLAEADGCDPERAIVMDTGARRSVIRDPACFDRMTSSR